MQRILNFNLVGKVYLYKETVQVNAFYVEPSKGFKLFGVQIFAPYEGHWRMNDSKITVDGSGKFFLKDNLVYEKPCAYIVYTSSIPNEWLRFQSYDEMLEYFKEIQEQIPGFKLIDKK